MPKNEKYFDPTQTVNILNIQQELWRDRLPLTVVKDKKYEKCPQCESKLLLMNLVWL